ncbi:hypothetical protein EYF80_045836 [Liparis tanakae]|uniref:Uncharacterized protein n=1 Tax=Liparis tanakae TaxID=230148 RepID=A0A4Z2FSJ9_9TELE|nr:hypothetical protein EYF80_045836 [Liparis tanakae]
MPRVAMASDRRADSKHSCTSAEWANQTGRDSGPISPGCFVSEGKPNLNRGVEGGCQPQQQTAFCTEPLTGWKMLVSRGRKVGAGELRKTTAKSEVFVAPAVFVTDRFDNPCTSSNSVRLLNEEPPSSSSPSNHFGLNPVETSKSRREQKGLTHRALYAAGAQAGVKCQRDVSHSRSCSCSRGFVSRVGEPSPVKNSSHTASDRLWLSQRCNRDGNAGVWVYNGDLIYAVLIPERGAGRVSQASKVWGEVPLPEDLEAEKAVQASQSLLDDDEDFAADEASGELPSGEDDGSAPWISVPGVTTPGGAGPMPWAQPRGGRRSAPERPRSLLNQVFVFCKGLYVFRGACCTKPPQFY